MQFDTVPTPAAEVGRESAGARLRLAREMRGESINEVSLALKLAPRQVEALESGRYDALPGLAFVRGFMRNYARYLGLDPAPLLADVQAVLGRNDVDLSPVSNAAGDLPNGGARRGSGGKPAGVIAAALLAIVLGGWYFDWFDTEPMRPVAEEIVPRAPASVSSPAPAVGVSGVAEPVMPAAGADVPQPTAAIAGAVPAAAAPVTAAAGQIDPPAPVAVESGADLLAFRFAGQSWVEVRDASGAIIHSGTGAPGSTRNVQGKAPFALVIGNASQVSLERGGQKVDLAPHIKGSVARLTLQ